MMWSNAPWPTEGSGQCYIPETIDFDFHEGPDEDEFVQILLDIMSRPISRKPMSPERVEQIKKGGDNGPR